MWFLKTLLRGVWFVITGLSDFFEITIHQTVGLIHIENQDQFLSVEKNTKKINTRIARMKTQFDIR